MITKIKIQNFKSIDQLEIELGRINVLIGANGSGKSNLLEGIAMGAAGIADKLEHEFLSTRIRVTPPKFMTSAFETDEIRETIKVVFTTSNQLGEEPVVQTVLECVNKIWRLKNMLLKLNNQEINDSVTKKHLRKLDTIKARTEANLLEIKKIEKELTELRIANEKKGDFTGNYPLLKFEKEALEWEKEFIDTNVFFDVLKNELVEKEGIFNSTVEHFLKQTNIKNFLIFAPENHFLRNFNEESQLRPIGLRGEGLFNHIVELHREKPALLAQINEALRVLDWFDGFEMPNDLMFTEKRIRIKDNYLQPDLSYFDQRSANEGFLYLLFYFTLFISDETPSFFAIDNIDNAMNPKLGRHLVKTLAELAKKHQKQALLTTHNPAILDGLNLDDDEQRLFVIYRNADGQTKARRIFKKKTDKNISLPLSEMFLRGYLGGLPNNF